jgi:hypothetical protein
MICCFFSQVIIPRASSICDIEGERSCTFRFFQEHFSLNITLTKLKPATSGLHVKRIKLTGDMGGRKHK